VTTGAARVPWRRPLAGRDPDEPHRASTPLELLFDLSFVVAVSIAAVELHHGVAEGHVAISVGRYLMVFFAIWWAWMNFSWFASAYDTDDAAYRLLTLVQIAGVLILAAGVHNAFEDEDFTLVTIGYLVMRVPLVLQWLGVARDDPGRRPVARRYALGVTVTQVGWVLRLALPATAGLVAFFVLVVADLAVPIWAERGGPMTRWHPGHIAERYGLFTLIVLGEVILAATTAVQAGLTERGASAALLGVAAGGLLLVFGLWWVYFARSAGDALRETPSMSFLWGYGHYLVFAAVGALGAGLEVATESVLHEAHTATRTAAFAVAVPVAVTLLVVGALQVRLAAGSAVLARCAVAAVLVLLAALVPPLGLAVLLMGAVAGLLVAAEIVSPQTGDWSTAHQPEPPA
jgi:low temperature requirement protein LtrA